MDCAINVQHIEWNIRPRSSQLNLLPAACANLTRPSHRKESLHLREHLSVTLQIRDDTDTQVVKTCDSLKGKAKRLVVGLIGLLD